MRKPKDPKTVVGMMCYLTSKIFLWKLADGTKVYAPKGMPVLIIDVNNRDPRIIFTVPVFDNFRRGFLVDYRKLTLKEPICECCKQSIASNSFTFSHP